MEKEFLKMKNRLVMELEIEPISPLIITMGSGRNNEESNKDSSIISFMTTESTRLPKEIKKEDGTIEQINETKKIVRYNENNDKLEEDYRMGEPFILGSTLRGLFREKFNQIYDYKCGNESPKISKNEKEEVEKIEKKEEKSTKNKIIKYDEVENLFGYTDDKKEPVSKKGRIFLDDAYLEEKNRKSFYSKNKNEILNRKRELFKTRSITPIDAFTGKAIVPLTVEYIEEKFFTTLTVNNISKEELKNIYFIIRDSHLGEIRIGNSKTRGFGQIKFNIKNLIFENYISKTENEKNIKFIDELKIFFEEPDEKNSIKIGNKYLKESLNLKKELRSIDVENPNQFIKTLFGEEE